MAGVTTPPPRVGVLSGDMGGGTDGRTSVGGGGPRLFFEAQIRNGEVVGPELSVGLGDLDEVGVGLLAELAGVGALELDFGRDPDLHEALGERADDPCHTPRPDEVDRDVDHLRTELADISVEETLDRAGDPVPARGGVGAV